MKNRKGFNKIVFITGLGRKIEIFTFECAYCRSVNERNRELRSSICEMCGKLNQFDSEQ